MKKIILLFAIFLIFSCGDIRESENSEIHKGYWAETFQIFWRGMDNNYVFWDIDPIDWDEVYEEYLPKFIALDEENNPWVGLQKARMYFEDITRNLVDGHFALKLKGGYGYIGPLSTRYYNDMEPELRIIENYYVSKDFNSHTIPQYSSYGKLNGFNATVGKIPIEANSNILYFRFSNFYWSYILDDNERVRVIWGNEPEYTKMQEYDGIQELQNIWNYFVNNLRAPDVKGIIIDVRNNGGGNSVDLSIIWGLMLSKEKHLVGYEMQKIESGRLDFSPLMPVYIFGNPKNSQDVKVPIVLLTNGSSISAAEHSALIVRSFPNGYIVGETTAGCMGSVKYKNSGIETSPGIEEIMISNTQSFDLNKKSFEGKGIKPDYFVPFYYYELSQGIDAKLEKAIEVIKLKR